MFWILAGIAAFLLLSKAGTGSSTTGTTATNLTSIIPNHNLGQRTNPAQGPPLNVFGGAPAPVGGPTIFRPIQNPLPAPPSGGSGGAGPSGGGGGSSGGGTGGTGGGLTGTGGHRALL